MTNKPTDLGPSGSALYDSLTSNMGFESHEAALLVEACRIQDRLDELDAVVRTDGVTVTGHGTVKAHPALIEARQQGIALARILTALRIPDEDGHQAQRRTGVRGTYGARR